MKTLVIYDSVYGNTEIIAWAIGEALGGQVLRPGEVRPGDLKRVDAVIVGSPTHGGRTTEAIQGLLEALPDLGGISVAAFDTRTVSKWNRILRFGYAAPRIAQSLERKGGMPLAPPEGFVVLGMQGPLREGELQRAAEWAKRLARRKA